VSEAADCDAAIECIRGLDGGPRGRDGVEVITDAASDPTSDAVVSDAAIDGQPDRTSDTPVVVDVVVDVQPDRTSDAPVVVDVAMDRALDLTADAPLVDLADGEAVAADLTCGAPLTACQGRCVDTSSDPEHCGACGRSCGPEPCQDGLCQPLVLGVSGQASGIVLDQTSVCWSDGTDENESPRSGSVSCALKSGASAPLVLASGEDSPSGIAMRDGQLLSPAGAG
jgi:hypothetical protein